MKFLDQLFAAIDEMSPLLGPITFMGFMCLFVFGGTLLFFAGWAVLLELQNGGWS